MSGFVGNRTLRTQDTSNHMLNCLWTWVQQSLLF